MIYCTTNTGRLKVRFDRAISNTCVRVQQLLISDGGCTSHLCMRALVRVFVWVSAVGRFVCTCVPVIGLP